MSAERGWRQIFRALGMAVVLAVLATLAVVPGEVGAGAPGSISGAVFRDLNGDGVRQSEEPGLADITMWIRQPLDFSESEFVQTRTDGSYSVPDIPPGDYEIWVLGFEPDAVGCPDAVVPTFNPLHSDCPPGAELPWNPTVPTTEVPVTVDPGGAVEIDFGAQPKDVIVRRGIAILETARVDAGTVIQAIVNGQECGSVQSQNVWYVLNVLGDGEKPGCAQPGDEVSFLVGGVPADRTITWTRPFYESSPRVRSLTLVAIQQHAWYWSESEGAGADPGSVVEAMVGDTKCGEATVERFDAFGGVIGFEQLLVPTAGLQPGCGAPGATVSFAIDGEVSGVTAGWAPGIEQIDLSGFEAPPAELPATGGPQEGSRSAAAVAVGRSLLIAGAVALLLARGIRRAS